MTPKFRNSPSILAPRAPVGKWGNVRGNLHRGLDSRILRESKNGRRPSDVGTLPDLLNESLGNRNPPMKSLRIFAPVSSPFSTKIGGDK